MRILFSLLLFLPSLAFSQLTINPSPVSGIADLDSISSTFTFTNPTTTPIVMNLALLLSQDLR